MAVMKGLVVARMHGQWMVMAPTRQTGFNTLEEAMAFAYEAAQWTRADDGAAVESYAAVNGG